MNHKTRCEKFQMSSIIVTTSCAREIVEVTITAVLATVSAAAPKVMA